MIVGAVYDTETKRNLTEARQRELNRVAFASLPLDLAIKKVKGNGERKLAIFSDADCPFCAKLETGAQGHRQRHDLHLPLSRSTSCTRTPRASRG